MGHECKYKTPGSSCLHDLSNAVKISINSRFGERSKTFRLEKDEFSIPAGDQISEHILYRLIDRVTDGEFKWQGAWQEQFDEFRQYVFNDLAPGIEKLDLKLSVQSVDSIQLDVKAIYRINAKPSWRERIEREVKAKLAEAVILLGKDEVSRRRAKRVHRPKIWLEIHDYQTASLILKYRSHKQPVAQLVEFRHIIPKQLHTYEELRSAIMKVDIEMLVIDEFVRLGMSDVVAPNLAARL